MPATPLSPNAEASVKTLREALSHPGAKLGNLARRIETAARDLQEGVIQWGNPVIQSRVLGHEIETRIKTNIELVVTVECTEGEKGITRVVRINLGPPAPPAVAPKCKPVGTIVQLREDGYGEPHGSVRIMSEPFQVLVTEDWDSAGQLWHDDEMEPGWHVEMNEDLVGHTVWAVKCEDVPWSEGVIAGLNLSEGKKAAANLPVDVVTHGPVPGDF